MNDISLAAYQDVLLLTSVTDVHMYAPEVQIQQEDGQNDQN